MSSHGQSHAQRALQDLNAAPLHQALNQMPTPLTVQQKTNFLHHIGKVFFFVLQEFKTNHTGHSLPWHFSDFPEAFHQYLFDLQTLTLIFMENSGEENYKLGARIMTLVATATTDEENNLLKFALQHLHSACPPLQRASGPALIKWLWQHHFDSLENQFEDLPAVKAFYHIS